LITRIKMCLGEILNKRYGEVHYLSRRPNIRITY
jgi:hypothetical protein